MDKLLDEINYLPKKRLILICKEYKIQTTKNNHSGNTSIMRNDELREKIIEYIKAKVAIQYTWG